MPASVGVAVDTPFQPETPASDDPAPTDELVITLVRAARRGERPAFDRLYDRFASMIHGVLVAHVPLGEVDDLMQEVFMQAFRQLASLRADAAFGGWLLTICRNRAHDFHRQRGTRPRTTLAAATDDDPGASASAAPTSGADVPAEAARILALLRELPEAYRETLALRLVEGMTGPEIAARTGLTPGSVRVNLHRGMRLLRERLASRSNDRGQ